MNHYSRFMPGEDLNKLYCALIRSVLEYSNVIYHPMISNYQSNRLKGIQKRCLRVMYGYKKSYGALLEESGLKTLKSRREEQFLKFARKTSENPNYSDLFPKKNNDIRTRNYKEYEERFARTDRLYRSPVYAMRRALNATPTSDHYNSPEYVDLSFLFNNPN